ncbi:seminal metalloprotease 1-like [Uranotaenia lowii]|uniref:seminal metalloprotease 1-like n=1 Tax=Uranotaenia lowii TaxID=190385 RepID=UPI0024793B42|nr:seminal metalloprotease 1-like [Uranotaenia lowii]
MGQKIISLVLVFIFRQVSTSFAQEYPFQTDFPWQGPPPWVDENSPRYPTDGFPVPLNPEAMGGYFEGDMILSQEQFRLMEGKNGVLIELFRWPHKTVPYVFEPNRFNRMQIAMIRKAMRRIERVTCVKFTPRTNQRDYIRIQGFKPGCSAQIGHLIGQQEVNFAPGCFQVGVLMHELIHVLGFVHMQSAPNRDEWVRILWKNIKPGHERNFDKYEASWIGLFGTQYDYGSIMHYTLYDFSKNGKKTMVPLRDTKMVGQRKGLSRADITKINRMYKCRAA